MVWVRGPMWVGVSERGCSCGPPGDDWWLLQCGCCAFCIRQSPTAPPRLILLTCPTTILRCTAYAPLDHKTTRRRSMRCVQRRPSRSFLRPLSHCAACTATHFTARSTTHLPQAEYALRTEALKAEPLEIIYSYYNGTGHRRAVTVRKGDTVGQFLKAVIEQLMPQFREIRCGRCRQGRQLEPGWGDVCVWVGVLGGSWRHMQPGGA